MNNNQFGFDGSGWIGNDPFGIPSNSECINDDGPWGTNSPVRGVLYPTKAELNRARLDAYFDNNAVQLTPRPDFSFDQSINYSNGFITGIETHNEFIDEEKIIIYFDDEKVWKCMSKKTIKKYAAGSDGKAKIQTVIKANGIPISGPIWFTKVDKFKRDDKPGKEYYCVCYVTSLNSDIKKVVVEASDVESDKLCLKIFPEGVKSRRISECSEFYRSKIYKLSSMNQEIIIPNCPGWYHTLSGWKFKDCSDYYEIGKENLPIAVSRRFVGRTDKSVNKVLQQLKNPLASNPVLLFLLLFKMVGTLLIFHEKYGISSHLITFIRIDNINQFSVVSTIFKNSDYDAYNIIPFESKAREILIEVKTGQDGIPVFLGSLTASEAKLNNKQMREARNAVMVALENNSLARCLMTIIGRFVPSVVSDELLFNVDCTDIPNILDLHDLRTQIRELDAAFTGYIEDNFDKVEGVVKHTIESYKVAPDMDILNKYQDIYIMLLSVRAVVRDCFGVEIIGADDFKKIKSYFTDKPVESSSPDYTVRDQFIDVVCKLLKSRQFTMLERQAANKNYPADKMTLILDRKKSFLSFPMSAMERITEMIPTVIDGAELAGILKSCNSIFCTDNGARQITAAGKRQAFYSVYLSEFGDAIFDIIDMFDKEEFFFHPEKVPDNFLPLIWYNGYCAGIVIDGEGLPNPHCNISGLSGMGKNRGAYRIAEGYRRLRTKVVFLDIKGGTTEDALKDMECDLSKYIIYDFKEEGFPFPIFNVSDFNGKNGKVSYILNVISAAVNLTDLQMYELSDYINDMIDEESSVFSLAELLERIPSKKSIGLKNKIQPLLHLLNAYTPKDGKYKYSSYKEFVCDTDKITNLSITQISDAALQTVVYSLLQSIFEHQILNSSNRIVVFADEMQKYTAGCPFKKMFAEGRQFNICMTGMTQEYRSKDNATRKDTSNASTEIFYVPATDSLKRVFDALGKKYNADEHQSKGRGHIWCKGYFWSNVDNRHKFVVLKGKNDDPDFYKLNSSPKGYYGNAI